LRQCIQVEKPAKNDPAKALKKWQATGEYLTAKVDGKSFEIVPLAV